jgi:NTP pyrophosphatase (non-canonical NTP hydrolase)
MQSLEKLNSLVIDWAREKGILNKATPLTQISKTIEEVEETRDALMMKQNGVMQYVNAQGKEKNTREEIKDGFGDILVTILIGIEMQGLTTSECLEQAYKVISKRKGKMIDGKFVKDGSTGN